MKLPKLMIITEANFLALPRIESICQKNRCIIQLRDKSQEAQHIYEYALQLRKITSTYGCLLFLNERTDIAMAVHADGVHLSEAGLAPDLIKQISRSLLAGVSVHSLTEGQRAAQKGADYLIFGPIYHTPSKIAFGAPQGTEKLRQITEQLSLPIYAVGGMTLERANDCFQAGAYGIAGISLQEEL